MFVVSHIIYQQIGNSDLFLFSLIYKKNPSLRSRSIIGNKEMRAYPPKTINECSAFALVAFCKCF